MKHTEGPWEVVEYVPSENATWGCVAKEGHTIVESQTHKASIIEIHSTTEHMENVFGSCRGGHLAEIQMTCGPEGRLRALANARLMATAPRLAKALTKITTMHNLIPYMAAHGQCECDPEVGACPCMHCAAVEILAITKQALEIAGVTS